MHTCLFTNSIDAKQHVECLYSFVFKGLWPEGCANGEVVGCLLCLIQGFVVNNDSTNITNNNHNLVILIITIIIVIMIIVIVMIRIIIIMKLLK